jgi:hypothetical protein
LGNPCVMEFPAEFLPPGCAEFPNDNPGLHDGVVWVCLKPGGPLRAIRRAAVAQTPGAPRAALPEPTQSEPASTEAPAVLQGSEAPASVTRTIVPRPPVLTPPRPAWRPGPGELKPKVCPPKTRPEPPPERGELVEPGGIAEAADPTPARFEPSPVPPAVLSAPPGPRDDVMSVTLLPIGMGCAAEGDEPPAGVPSEAEGGVAHAAEGAGETESVASEAPSAEPPAAEPPSAEPLAEAAGAATTTPPEPDAFDALVAAMVTVALTSGSTRAAAVLPRFLRDGRVEAAGMDGTVVETLARRRVAERSGGHLVATGEGRVVMDAWRDVLRGQSADLSACGATTLDNWAAEVLDAFGVIPPEGDLRRALRKKGVAAFGMRLAA